MASVIGAGFPVHYLFADSVDVVGAAQAQDGLVDASTAADGCLAVAVGVLGSPIHTLAFLGLLGPAFAVQSIAAVLACTVQLH